MSESQGGCLCGAVRFTAHNLEETFHACHCDMCRKWLGSPAFGVVCHGPVTIDGGEDVLRWYDSSEWAERGFCSTCGSSLFYRIKGDTPMWGIQVGALDDPSALTMGSELFIDRKPDSYAFAGDRDRLTAEQVEALFASLDEIPEQA